MSFMMFSLKYSFLASVESLFFSLCALVRLIFNIMGAIKMHYCIGQVVPGTYKVLKIEIWTPNQRTKFAFLSVCTHVNTRVSSAYARSPKRWAPLLGKVFQAQKVSLPYRRNVSSKFKALRNVTAPTTDIWSLLGRTTSETDTFLSCIRSAVKWWSFLRRSWRYLKQATVEPWARRVMKGLNASSPRKTRQMYRRARHLYTIVIYNCSTA